jgi:hypothetical protein
MKKVTPGLCNLICLCVVSAAGASAQHLGIVDNSPPAFTTFEVPGAATGANQGTFGASLNTAGTITGFYVDTAR